MIRFIKRLLHERKLYKLREGRTVTGTLKLKVMLVDSLTSTILKPIEERELADVTLPLNGTRAAALALSLKTTDSLRVYSDDPLYPHSTKVQAIFLAFRFEATPIIDAETWVRLFDGLIEEDFTEGGI